MFVCLYVRSYVRLFVCLLGCLFVCLFNRSPRVETHLDPYTGSDSNKMFKPS